METLDFCNDWMSYWKADLIKRCPKRWNLISSKACTLRWYKLAILSLNEAIKVVCQLIFRNCQDKVLRAKHARTKHWIVFMFVYSAIAHSKIFLGSIIKCLVKCFLKMKCILNWNHMVRETDSEIAVKIISHAFNDSIEKERFRWRERDRQTNAICIVQIFVVWQTMCKRIER